MNLSRLILLLPVFLVMLSCTNNDAQSEFEQKAYSQPEGITQTDQNGNVVGDEDPDDWRTSPFYAGLAEIEPSFPNPLLYSETASLEVFLNGTPFTSILELGYFDFQDRWTQIDLEQDISEFSVSSLTIDPQFFGSNVSLARGTYRLIVFDGNQRVITYGDITIE